MEQIDFFDSDYNYIGATSIDEIHQKGLWHQTVAFWLFNPKERVVYLQLRGPKNRVGPNTFDATSSGHLSSGESKEDGVRELKEELGFSILPEKCIYFKMYKNIVHLPNYINHEFCHIYFVETSYLLQDFVLEDGEVSNMFALNIDDVHNFLKGKSVEITSLKEKRTITLNDMCAASVRIENGYYKDVLNELFKRINLQCVNV